MLNELNSDIEKSYLGIIEDVISKKNVCIYEIHNNDLISTKKSNDEKTVSVFIVKFTLSQIFSLKRLLPEIIKKIQPNDKLHLLIEPSTSKFMSYFTIFPYLLTKRELLKC